tara:strand:- start:5589 stop:6488 length:900 start_codon:yes stop_codon:yes gene_type:complete
VSVSNKSEFAGTYGCLDTDALADGQATHSHALRELTRSVNRLLQMREPVINVVFDASTDGGEITLGSNFGYINAVRFGSLIFGENLFFSKKANHRYIDVRVIAKLTQDFPFTFHVETSETQLTGAPESENPGFLRVIGSGNYQSYEIKNVPVSANEVEKINIFLQGSSTDNLGDTAVNGAPNSGNGDFAFNLQTGELIVNGATWNTGNTTSANWALSGKNYVVIRDYTTSAAICEPRKITQVYKLGSTQTNKLYFEPIPNSRNRQVVNDAANPAYSWEIQEAGKYRIANVSAYSKLQVT